MTFHEVTRLIQKRKTTYASDYSDKHIEKSTIEAIVNNALWAPTHKLTQPWRFVVLDGRHRNDLGEEMAKYYRELYDLQQFSNERFEATKNYANNATLLGVIFKPNKRAKLPEWEEIAAISCAVQNMWLSCTALGIGCYWDTSTVTIAYGRNIKCSSEEKFLGVFFMGYPKEGLINTNRRRKSLAKKLSWDNKK